VNECHLPPKTRRCGHPLGTTRWCPDCELAQRRTPADLSTAAPCSSGDLSTAPRVQFAGPQPEEGDELGELGDAPDFSALNAVLDRFIAACNGLHASMTRLRESNAQVRDAADAKRYRALRAACLSPKADPVWGAAMVLAGEGQHRAQDFDAAIDAATVSKA
jgi:hypothetical protein